MKDGVFIEQPIAVIGKDQLWRRKIDQKPLVVMSAEFGTVFYYEHGNPRNTGTKTFQQWCEQCYLMGSDEILSETGGIF